MLAEFAVNNKIYSATKVFLFITNYGRELRMGADIRRKDKVKKVTEFVKRMRKVQEKVEAALRKAQKKIRSRKVEKGQKGDAKYKKLSIQRKTHKEVDRDMWDYMR